MWYDLVVLAILLIFTIRGAMKGMVWQLAGIAGIVICFLFADAISRFAGPYVPLEDPLNSWVVLLGAYVFFTFIAYLLAGQISESLDKAKLRDFDRHLGAIFGFVKGVVLSLILTFLVVTVSDDARTALLQSRSGYAAAKIVDTLHPYLPILPDNLRLALEKYIHLLDHPDFDLKHGQDYDHGSHDDVLPENLSQSQLETLWSDLGSLVSSQAQRAISDAINSEGDPESRSQLINGMVKILEQTSPEDRQKIEQHFLQLSNQGSSELLSHIATQLGVQITPPNVDLGPPDPEVIVPEPSVTDLARRIAEKYTTSAQQQSAYEKQIVVFLESLPEAVQVGVLKDWNADIWLLPDPDQQTNAQSTLEQRIGRQLQIAGVPFWRLDRAMQDRLRSAGVDVDSPR